jgi:hypothetical protein
MKRSSKEVRCKVCLLPKETREWVETMVTNKTLSLTDISKSLVKRVGKDKAASRASVSRHKSGCMQVVETEVGKVYEAIPVPPEVDLETTSNLVREFSLQAQEPLLYRSTHRMRMGQLMYEKILEQHQLVVATKMDQYTRGNGEYPKDQLAGLVSVQKMMKDAPISNETLQRTVLSHEKVFETRIYVKEFEQLKFNPLLPGEIIKNHENLPVPPEPDRGDPDIFREVLDAWIPSHFARLEWEWCESHTDTVIPEVLEWFETIDPMLLRRFRFLEGYPRSTTYHANNFPVTHDSFLTQAINERADNRKILKMLKFLEHGTRGKRYADLYLH